MSKKPKRKNPRKAFTYRGNWRNIQREARAKQLEARRERTA